MKRRWRNVNCFRFLTIIVSLLIVRPSETHAQNSVLRWSGFTAATRSSTGSSNGVLTSDLGELFAGKLFGNNVNVDGGFLPGYNLLSTTGNTLTVTMHPGWNMVSVPLIANTYRDTVLFPGAVSHAFRFSGGYIPEDTLQNGVGYWLKFASENSTLFHGTSFTSDTIDVLPGWNMIGSISSPVDTSTIIGIPSGLRSSIAWFGYNGGYTAAPTIQPGRAYWVKANGAGSFVLSAGSAPGKAGASGDDVFATMNSITIRDAAGRSQTLYFGAGDGLLEYAMPPRPPEGAFDARFGTPAGGAVMKTHAAGASLPVSIQSAIGPISISWSISNGAYGIDAGQGLIPISGQGMHVLTSAPMQLTLRSTGSPEVPTEYSLMQNYPNPFNPSTTIRFSIPAHESGAEPRPAGQTAGKHAVSLQVFDLLGQQVMTLVDDIRGPGTYSVRFDASSLPAGVYFYRLQSGGFTQVHKALLLK
jgi:hypothetical protein